MTNKEKAKEIANLCKTCIGDGINDCGECEMRWEYFGALKMAEWKDQQFKAYLEKKRKKYTNGLSIALQKNAKQEAVVNDKIQCLLNEIIKELFKED